MDIKIIILVIFTLIEIYSLFLDAVSLKNRPIPSNVSDIYDNESYQTWKKYKKEKIKLSIYKGLIEFIIVLVLLVFDVYALIARQVSENIYLQTLVVLGIYYILDLVLSFIFGYIDDMIIEEKYGFNKMTLKIFIVDNIKGFLVSVILLTGLIMLFVLLYSLVGNFIILVFFGVLVIVLLLAIFLAPILSKGFNKFESLEQGELRDKLTDLLNKYGYKVKDIEVMKASEKTTKSNAYFTGFGKIKTIVLYDTLIECMSSDELCAIFAHELAHGLNKDTLKTNISNLLTIALIVLSMFVFIKVKEVHYDFGFNNINYGFAFLLLTYIALPFISTLMGLITNAISRKAEYKADAQAVKEGYGKDLISALKKLTKANFGELSPSKIIVKLNYSHPTLSQRIGAIEKLMNNNEYGEN